VGEEDCVTSPKIVYAGGYLPECHWKFQFGFIYFFFSKELLAFGLLPTGI